MKQFWKFLQNNSEVSEAVGFDAFFDAFIANGSTGFTNMPQQFYIQNNIESLDEYVPVAKITFNELELYIDGRWCKVQIEFLTSIPNWEPSINYTSCIGEDCRRVYNLHYSSFCEEQADVIDRMNFRDKLLAYYNWGIKSYIPANMCNERIFRRSTRGCENYEDCEDCREWRDSSICNLPKLNDLLNPYDENNIPLLYKIQIIDENITPSLESMTNWKLFLQNERKELLTFVTAIGAKKAETKMALLFKIAKNRRPDWIRHLSGY